MKRRHPKLSLLECARITHRLHKACAEHVRSGNEMLAERAIQQSERIAGYMQAMLAHGIR